MKVILYLAIAFCIFWIIKNVLKSENVSNKAKDYKRLNGDYDQAFLRVDPNGKNDGLNIDTAEIVSSERNEKLYKTPDGKWFNVYQLPKGERSYQRLTPWEARNRIKTQHMGSREDCEALLAKHDLTGTKDELHIKDVPNFAPRKYIPLDEQKKRR
ncbi:MAG: hypothetical protein PVF38_11670 [Desulfobacterales bacterium]|jgi:hypothetical protein